MSAENITKDGVEVKVGQLWQDCDKRVGTRIRKVVGIENGKALMAHPPSQRVKTKISIRRMHRSSTGWVLIRDIECPAKPAA